MMSFRALDVNRGCPQHEEKRSPINSCGLVLQSHSITTKPLIAGPFVHISSVDDLKSSLFGLFQVSHPYLSLPDLNLSRFG